MKKKFVQILLSGTFLLSGCAVPLLESPAPMEPGKVQVGLYTDMIMSQAGLGLMPTGIILRAGIMKNTSISLRASVYGAGMDLKRSFGKNAISIGFNSFISSFLFSDTTDLSSGWTWVHATWMLSSKKYSSSYDAFFLSGLYAFLPTRDTRKSAPWGLRAAIGISSKNLSSRQSPISFAMEYGFLIPVSNKDNPLEEYYGDLFVIPYGAVGIFLSF